MIFKFKLYYQGQFVGFEWHREFGNNGFIIIEHSRDGNNWESVRKDYIRHDEKRLFTQKKDKNGTEIYHKDRVEVRKEIKTHEGKKILKLYYTDRIYWCDGSWHMGNKKMTRMPISYYKSRQLECVETPDLNKGEN